MTHFPPVKWRLSGAAISILSATFLENASTFDQNPQTILRLVEQFSKKLTISVFHSTWKRWKRKQNLGGGEDSNFTTVSSRLQDPLAQPFKKKEKEKENLESRGKIFSMAGICYRKPAIKKLILTTVAVTYVIGKYTPIKENIRYYK